MAANDEGSWRTLAYIQGWRSGLIRAIEDSGSSTSKNATEIENEIFQMAKDEAEYITRAAIIIFDATKLSQSRNAQAQRMPDPIGALQTSAPQSTGNNQMMEMGAPVPGPQGMVQLSSPNSSTVHISQAPPLLPNLPENDEERDTQC